MVTPSALNRARLRAWIPNASCTAGRSTDRSCIRSSWSGGMVPLSQLRSAATPGLGRLGPAPRAGARGTARPPRHRRPCRGRRAQRCRGRLAAVPWRPPACRRGRSPEARAGAPRRWRHHRAPGGQLLELIVAVVDPDLDHVDVLRRELPHGRSGFFFGCDPSKESRCGRLAAQRVGDLLAGSRGSPPRHVLRRLERSADTGPGVCRHTSTGVAVGRMEALESFMSTQSSFH